MTDPARCPECHWPDGSHALKCRAKNPPREFAADSDGSDSGPVELILHDDGTTLRIESMMEARKPGPGTAVVSLDLVRGWLAEINARRAGQHDAALAQVLARLDTISERIEGIEAWQRVVAQSVSEPTVLTTIEGRGYLASVVDEGIAR